MKWLKRKIVPICVVALDIGVILFVVTLAVRSCGRVTISPPMSGVQAYLVNMLVIVLTGLVLISLLWAVFQLSWGDQDGFCSSYRKGR